jgi:hypothetical protein
MGKLTSEITFTGSVGGITAYRMQGVNQIIVRKKGGPSKKQLNTGPQYEFNRLKRSQFSGRSTAGSHIMRAMRNQKPLKDYPLLGELNKLMVPIQDLDETSGLGKKSIQLSKNPGILDGFSTNKKYTLESIIRTPLTYSLSKEDLSARIEIPKLIPGINFHAAQRHAMYSFIVELGIVPDLFHVEGNRYAPAYYEYERLNSQTVFTEWFPVQKGSASTVVEFSYETPPPDSGFTLMLSFGIRFGRMADATTIEQVKKAGAAKILMAV